MKSGVPVSELAPLEYRNALDIAMTVLRGQRRPLVICNIKQLEEDLGQRLNFWEGASNVPAGLWVEPQASTLKEQLHIFSKELAPTAKLVIIVSRPLARTLPERRNWKGEALATGFGGVLRLRVALKRSGYRIESAFGFHSAGAILLNFWAYQLERLSFPHLADRLHFAARLHYRTKWPWLSTVTLLVAAKEKK